MKKAVVVLLVLVTAAALAQQSENDKAVLSKLKNQIVTINFQETPVEEAIHFFQDITGLKFIISRDCTKDICVSLRLREIRLENALHFVLIPNGLDYIVKGGTVHIVSREKIAELMGEPIRHKLPDLKPDRVLLILNDGSRIEGKVSFEKWKLKTAYGELVIPANEIRGITVAREMPKGTVDEVETVRFSITGKLGFDKLEIDTGKGKLSIPRKDIKAILFSKLLADKTFDVKATGEWLDTKIPLREDCRLKIASEGKLTLSNPQDESEIILYPDGGIDSVTKVGVDWTPPEWYGKEFPLLARIGRNGKPFVLYQSAYKYSCEMCALRRGNLYLKIRIPRGAEEAAKTFKGAYKTKVRVEK